MSELLKSFIEELKFKLGELSEHHRVYVKAEAALLEGWIEIQLINENSDSDEGHTLHMTGRALVERLEGER